MEAQAMQSGSDVRGSVQAVEANLNQRFVDRRDEIRGMIVAALAGEHVLLIGPPGTGKSALAREFSDAISGANYFEWLLTRFSTPDELFGPISLSGLKSDRFRRVTAGKLPEAHVAFLDEIFKANSGVLNSLLAAVNERVFHDDGAVREIPLLTCIGASNELPEGEELSALWDRFVLRFDVSYTKGDASFLSMLEGPSVPPARGVLSLDAWKAARAEVSAMPFPRETMMALFRVREELHGKGVVVSDRRWRKAANLARASAWISGASSVSPRHLSILKACLWNERDQISDVENALASVTKSAMVDVTRIVTMMADLVKAIPVGPQEIERSTAVVAELKKALVRIEAIRADDESAGGGEQAEIVAAIATIRTAGNKVQARVRELVGAAF